MTTTSPVLTWMAKHRPGSSVVFFPDRKRLRVHAEFEDFRRGPADVRRDGVKWPLAANGFFAKFSLGVNDETENEHFFTKDRGVLLAADVPRNVVTGSGPSKKDPAGFFGCRPACGLRGMA